MGIKENLINNWKDSTIEYQGKKLYVIEQVEFNENLYIYTIMLDELPELKINFLKRVKDSTFEVVTDMKLFDKLLADVGIKIAASEVQKLINERKNKK